MYVCIYIYFFVVSRNSTHRSPDETTLVYPVFRLVAQFFKERVSPRNDACVGSKIRGMVGYTVQQILDQTTEQYAYSCEQNHVPGNDAGKREEGTHLARYRFQIIRRTNNILDVEIFFL